MYDESYSVCDGCVGPPSQWKQASFVNIDMFVVRRLRTYMYVHVQCGQLEAFHTVYLWNVSSLSIVCTYVYTCLSRMATKLSKLCCALFSAILSRTSNSLCDSLEIMFLCLVLFGSIVHCFLLCLCVCATSPLLHVYTSLLFSEPHVYWATGNL